MSAERNINDTELLSAYIDGQLTMVERSALEARLQSDAELRHQLALLRATVDLIRDLPQLAAPRDFRLTREMVGRRAGNRPIYTFSVLSAAAAVVLLVVGFGLLTVNNYNAASSPFSRTVNNLETDGDPAGIALVPTGTFSASPMPSTAPPSIGFFAAEEQVERGTDLESEIAGEQAQQGQATQSQMFQATAPAAAIQIAPVMGTADEVDDTSTTTTGEDTTDDGRFRDTQQAEPFSESLASALPFDAVAQPSQEGAGGMLALQPTVPPPTSTPFPTLLLTRTAIPTETPTHTPTHSPTQTNTSMPSIAPAQPPSTNAPAVQTETIAIILIVSAVVLLVASVSALIVNRRR